MTDFLGFIPKEETQERIARAVEKIADLRVPADYSQAPGSKFLIAGDRKAGFFGFVQPEEFGKIGDVTTGNDFDGQNLALEVGLSQGTSIFSNTAWMKFSLDDEIIFFPVKPLRHSVAWDSIYNAGAVYGASNEGELPPAGRMGTDLVLDSSDNSINTVSQNFLGDKSSGMSYADTIANVGDILVLKGFPTESNNGEVTVVSITNTKIVVSGIDLVSENGTRSSKVYNKAKAVTQNKEVTIGGLKYSVELMSMSGDMLLNSYLDNDRGSTGQLNDYNKLILPLHEHSKLNNWNYPQYAKDKDGNNIEDWGVGLTDKDFQSHYTLGAGNYRWGKNISDTETWRRANRGYLGSSNLDCNFSWYAYSNSSWSPVLKLKQA